MAEPNGRDFAAGADRFVEDLSDGVPIADALEAATDVAHHPDVVEAGIAMLAESGAIDMKQLARDAGMSRASLYRHYPDKEKVESEIAGIGIEGMVTAARQHDTSSGKFHAAAEYLIDHPGEAAALIPFAAMVSVTVLRATVEHITGDAASAALIVGVAVMAATPGRHEGDVDTLHHYVDEIASLLR